MRRERRNHAIASARARGRASTRQRFLAAPVGRGLGRGRLAGWRRHATGCDGRAAASGEVRAVGPRAPILVSVGRLLASRPSGKKLALSRRPERAPCAENAAETFRGSSAPGRELRTIPDLSHSFATARADARHSLPSHVSPLSLLSAIVLRQQRRAIWLTTRAVLRAICADHTFAAAMPPKGKDLEPTVADEGEDDSGAPSRLSPLPAQSGAAPACALACKLLEDPLSSASSVHAAVGRAS